MNVDVLPEFVDNILIYLEDNLPAPLYSFLIKALSHCLALLTAAQGVFAALLSRSPADWDAQAILPPLITLLAAYWALLSFYRTTTWFLRTTFSLLKWGAIIGSLLAATGMLRGDNIGELIGGNVNVAGQIGKFLYNQLWGMDANPTDRAQSRPYRTKRTRTGSSSQQRNKPKPKPWESFEQHRQWKEQETEQSPDVEEIINNIAAAADEVLQNNQWWSAARRFIPAMSGFGGQQTTNEHQERRSSRSSRNKAGSRSR